MKSTLGKREQNKQDKLERITAAAREAFLCKGYEEATLSEIAHEARVAKGTLFLYASNKGDLLVLVFRSVLQPVVEADFARALEVPLIERLLIHFNAIVDYNLEYPQLASPFLKELSWVPARGREEMIEFIDLWIGGLAAWIQAAQAKGDVDPDSDPRLLSLMLVDVFIAAQCRLFSGIENYETFAQNLPTIFGLLLRGFRPQ
nr:TetR/AcrR family transcriptional regulator [Pseudomonas insulae]